MRLLPVVAAVGLLAVVLAGGGAYFFLSGSTSALLAQQASAETEAERVSLTTLQAMLRNDPTLQEGVTASVFLSSKLINQALTGADSQIVKASVPGSPDAAITVAHVRAQFEDGFAKVDAEVHGVDAKHGLHVDVSMTAVLTASIVDNALVIRPHIVDLIPKAQWGIFDFTLRGLARDIARSKADTLAAKLPYLEIPITHDIDFIQAPQSRAISIPTGNGSTIQGIIAVPGINYRATLAISHVVFLSDGVRVFLRKV